MHLAIASLLVFLLAAPQEAETALTELPFQPTKLDGRLHPDLYGVWQARGYGWLAHLDPDEPRIYDHAPFGTLAQEADPGDLLEGVHFRRAGDVMQLTTLPGSSTIYTWDRQEELPEACANPPGTDPMSVFDYFWGVMDHHYAYFEERGVDWEARRREHRPRVTPETSEAELWEILCDMLSGFHDDHMSLSGVVDGEEEEFDEGFSRELDPALEAAFAAQDEISNLEEFRAAWAGAYRRNIQDTLLQGEFKIAASRQVLWGRIGPIGYINLRGMGGFAQSEDSHAEAKGVHALMGRILTELADCEGLILDITLNTGGYDEVQMAISSHFVDEPRLAFTKRPLDTPDAPLQPFYLFPAEGPRYLGPVSLVTSNFSVSAAEDFTLAMRQLPHVTHRGTRTRGAFSDILEKPLPNGWVLALSNEAYLDVDGNNWEAKGVSPEVHVPIFVADNLEYSHVDAIFAIVDAMIAEAE